MVKGVVNFREYSNKKTCLNLSRYYEIRNNVLKLKCIVYFTEGKLNCKKMSNDLDWLILIFQDHAKNKIMFYINNYNGLFKSLRFI